MALQAVELFSRMPSELITDTTYVCVLNACSHAGLVNEAQAIFSSIKNKTEYVYVTMVNLKQNLFFNFNSNISRLIVSVVCFYLKKHRNSLMSMNRVIPHHHLCLVSFVQYLKRKSGYLMFLVALLSGARNKNDCFLAEKTFNRIQENFSQDRDLFIAASVLLSNVYASTGDLDKANEIRKKISKVGVKKKVGLSWTEVNGKIFVSNFVSRMN